MLGSAQGARRLAWLLIGVLLGLALLLTLPERAPSRAGTVGAPAPSDDAPPAAERPVAPTPATARAADGPAPASAATGRATRALMERGDLHALAIELLAEAGRGDAAAQHELHLVLEACAAEVRRYADRAEFEAFLETVPGRSGIDPEHYADLQRDRFEACAGFRDDPIERFGTPLEWQARAIEAGDALAKLASLARPAEREAAGPGALREAALAALATGRTEAYMQMLELEFPDADVAEARDATPNAAAWWLLACARGYPCGPDARWRREQLAFTSGPRNETGWEDALLFNLPAHERELARERAAELARLIDAGELEATLPLGVR